jgi:hypothetical protein
MEEEEEEEEAAAGVGAVLVVAYNWRCCSTTRRVNVWLFTGAKNVKLGMRGGRRRR